MLKPKVCILRTDGINCDEELFYAFEKFGGAPEYVHVNEFRGRTKKLNDFQILAIPGGFSYGDDVASGKILAVELISFLNEQLQQFIHNRRLIIGICNGFQVLVRTGLLPFGNLGEMDVTLRQNYSGYFECRWVSLKAEKNRCLFVNSNTATLQFAVNHGEGRFYAPTQTIKEIENGGLVVFRYIDERGRPTQNYPQNPNGSLSAIAGICDPTGRILGLMPHPEKFVDISQHPNWRREKIDKPHGAFIFEGIVGAAKES